MNNSGFCYLPNQIPTFNPTSSPTQLENNYVSNIIISEFVGNGVNGSTDGAASIVQFDRPFAMCMDNNAQYLYIPSYTAETIRRTSTSDGFTVTLGNFILLFFVDLFIPLLL